MKRIALSLILPVLLATLTAAEVAPKVGCQAPALQLNTLGGKTVSLAEQLGKKKTVLVFFTSWSRSCQAELQALGELTAAQPDKLRVLAVSFDKKSKELKSFIERTDPPFTVLHDQKLTSIDSYQILIIPTTFCLNRDGEIEQIFVDYDENVREAIAAWLKD
jgi:peroxiredoxin